MKRDPITTLLQGIANQDPMLIALAQFQAAPQKKPPFLKPLLLTIALVLSFGLAGKYYSAGREPTYKEILHSYADKTPQEEAPQEENAITQLIAEHGGTDR